MRLEVYLDLDKGKYKGLILEDSDEKIDFLVGATCDGFTAGEWSGVSITKK